MAPIRQHELFIVQIGNSSALEDLGYLLYPRYGVFDKRRACLARAATMLNILFRDMS